MFEPAGGEVNSPLEDQPTEAELANKETQTEQNPLPQVEDIRATSTELNQEIPKPSTFSELYKNEIPAANEIPRAEPPPTPELNKQKVEEQETDSHGPQSTDHEVPVILTPQDIADPVKTSSLTISALRLVSARRMQRARLSRQPNFEAGGKAA